MQALKGVEGINALAQALHSLIRAFETLDPDHWTVEIWDAYWSSRVLLADPVTLYPGGYNDNHFHIFDWQPEDGCETCDEYAEEKRVAEEEDAKRNAQPG